jgi:hypothetical protein
VNGKGKNAIELLNRCNIAGVITAKKALFIEDMNFVRAFYGNPLP